MKDVNGEIQYKDKVYKIVFNLNVMEAIQTEYGSLSAWGDVTGASDKEPEIKAILFGYEQMINEGIDIENEENGTDMPHLNHKTVGRIVTEVGMQKAKEILNNTVIESTKSEIKNE